MAIRRDWEQTVHDLTGGGHDLNQDASETLRQAHGQIPTPVGNTPNPPDVHDKARHARADARAELKDAKAAAAADVKSAKADGDSEMNETKARAASDVKTAKANANADIKSANDHEKRWEQSESAVRYGFGAGMSPQREWSTSRGEMRDEWTALDGGRTWDEAEDDVRRGWDGARKANA